jgi:argininosuccinate lyase
VREKNIPFRTAHFITGKAVAKAESLGLDLSELNKEQLKSVDENLDENAIKFLDLHASKEVRTSKGGTANKSVEEQIKILDDWLK